MIRCSDNSIYTGMTNNLERRIEEHITKDKRGAKYTKSNIHLIAGVNLPLLFELIMNLESENTVQMIENAIQNAKEQLQYCNPLIQCSITEENF